MCKEIKTNYWVSEALFRYFLQRANLLYNANINILNLEFIILMYIHCNVYSLNYNKLYFLSDFCYLNIIRDWFNLKIKNEVIMSSRHSTINCTEFNHYYFLLKKMAKF